MKASFRYALASVSLAALPFLSGCNTTSPQVQERVIAIPSSAPYRYIKPSPTEDKLSEDLVRQIERHNNVHWRVKEAEKRAKNQEQ